MRDEPPNNLQRRVTLQSLLANYLSSHGYQTIDTPILQPTELFLRKSGGELANRMYSFTDAGGNKISLRPEFTASVIRHYLENADDYEIPLKVQYNGPVFRYDNDRLYRQFHQVGAEVIGSADSNSDGEILGLAFGCASELGLLNTEVVLGHVGVLHLIFENMGLSQKSQNFLISNLPRIKKNKAEIETLNNEASNLGLIKNPCNNDSAKLIENMDDVEALKLLKNLFRDSLSGLVGSRSTEEILGRFVYKLRRGDTQESIENGLELCADLVETRGPEETALANITAIIKKYGVDPNVLEPLERVLITFHSLDKNPNLIVDLSLVRGIAYYTGMVFEIIANDNTVPTLICGGGRYDGLIKALGGKDDTPALGFAYDMDSIIGLLS